MMGVILVVATGVLVDQPRSSTSLYAVVDPRIRGLASRV